MKKEQILDMIGEAPDAYVADAKAKPRRRRTFWLGGIAAVLVIALFVNLPTFPMIITAKAVSKPTESRKLSSDDFRNGEHFDREGFEQMMNERDAILAEAAVSISAFTGDCAAYVLCGADDENRLFSPINAYIALSMTAELVGGETQTQLLDALGASSTDTLRTYVSTVWEQVNRTGSERIALANALWLDRDVQYVQETMDHIAYHYYASVYQGDLGSARTERDMTAWMKNNTGGMIRERKSADIAAEDLLLTLTSAIDFQSKWYNEFHASQNTRAAFHAYGGDVTCTFMNKKEIQTYYYWADDFGAVALGLKNGALMWFFLPDEGKTVDDVLASDAFTDMMTQTDLTTAYENSKYMKVNLSVPQFDVASSADLKDALQSMGVTDIFDPTAGDFSPSLSSDDDTPAYLAAIRQDVRVKIDEKGVTAAAYIEIPGAGAAMPPEEIIDFVLDRPFVFAISRSEIPLFVGTVNLPQ
ncbi:MAG: hypothetical protein IKZ09_11495 [Clostridia bacterium]|nr:hypothetical protein [Clostridia bacterium]